MSSTRAARLAAAPLTLALAAAACGGSGSSASTPSNLSILPYCVENRAATTVTFRGTLPAKAIVSQSGSNEVDTTYRAWLGDPGAGAAAVELTGVTWNDARSATGVVPAGVAAGSYPVFVQGPFGGRVRLDQQVEVRASGCPPVNPVLTTTVNTPPRGATVGQVITIEAVVQNGGQSPALKVAAAIPAAPAGFEVVSSPAGPQDIPGGQAATFAWKVRPTATTGASGVRYAVDAEGVDLSGARVAAARATSALLVVNPPATLTVNATVPQVAYVGRAFKVSLAFSNSGGAPATVNPVVTASATAGAQVSVASPAPGQSVPAAGDALLEWSYTVSAPCNVTFAIDLSNASDANSGAPISITPVSTRTTSVQALPALAVLDPAYGPVGRSDGRVVGGGRLQLTLDVRNTGAATAAGVSATVLSAPAEMTVRASPGPQDIGPNGTGHFAWEYAVGNAPTGDFQIAIGIPGLPSFATVSKRVVVNHFVSVTVSGLGPAHSAIFVLTTNEPNRQEMPIAGDHSIPVPFPTPVASGSTYSIDVTTPQGGGTCGNRPGAPPPPWTGTVGASDVTVAITCN